MATRAKLGNTGNTSNTRKRKEEDMVASIERELTLDEAKEQYKASGVVPEGYVKVGRYGLRKAGSTSSHTPREKNPQDEFHRVARQFLRHAHSLDGESVYVAKSRRKRTPTLYVDVDGVVEEMPLKTWNDVFQASDRLRMRQS